MIDGGDIVDLDGVQPVGDKDNTLDDELLDEDDLCIMIEDVMLNMIMLFVSQDLSFKKYLEYALVWMIVKIEAT